MNGKYTCLFHVKGLDVPRVFMQLGIVSLGVLRSNTYFTGHEVRALAALRRRV